MHEFNWVLPHHHVPGAKTDHFQKLGQWCSDAEQSGFDAILIASATRGPDTMVLASGLARSTEKIRLIVQHSPRLMSPTLFVQQINTCSLLSGGRVDLLITANDPLNHISEDDSDLLMDEYISVCKAFWRKQGPVDFRGSVYRIEEGLVNTPFSPEGSLRPRLFLSQHSEAGNDVLEHADTLILEPGLPGQIYEKTRLIKGQEAAINLRFICASTREQARMVAKRRFGERVAQYESSHFWRLQIENNTETLLVTGVKDDVSDAVVQLAEAGIRTFFLHGGYEEMVGFGCDIMPQVRRNFCKRPGPEE